MNHQTLTALATVVLIVMWVAFLCACGLWLGKFAAWLEARRHKVGRVAPRPPENPSIAGHRYIAGKIPPETPHNLNRAEELARARALQASIAKALKHTQKI